MISGDVPMSITTRRHGQVLLPAMLMIAAVSCQRSGSEGKASEGATADGPRVKLPTRQFSASPENGHVRHRFVVRNVGSEELTLKVEETCGCAPAKLEDQRVPPGEQTHVHVDLDVNTRLSSSVLLHTNDPNNRITVLSIAADRVPAGAMRLAFIPAIAHVTAAPGARVRGQVLLKLTAWGGSIDESVLEEIRLTSDDERLQTRLIPADSLGPIGFADRQSGQAMGSATVRSFSAGNNKTSSIIGVEYEYQAPDTTGVARAHVRGSLPGQDERSIALMTVVVEVR